MLILSRKEDESIVIGDNITIKVVSVEKGLVKLGIDAPSDVTILRSELLDAVEASNKEAAGVVDDSLLSDFHIKFNK
ncbi:MAG: carbon storage regulator CsrA [Campylobacterota bacterium]|nr:carbon storage regulator CsrA [Campylobacterota bacterium]